MLFFRPAEDSFDSRPPYSTDAFLSLPRLRGRVASTQGTAAQFVQDSRACEPGGGALLPFRLISFFSYPTPACISLRSMLRRPSPKRGGIKSNAPLPVFFETPGASSLFFRPSNEGMERREALGACEAPLADLAIDPPEHRAKAFARLAIGTLAFRRSTPRQACAVWAICGISPLRLSSGRSAPERGYDSRAEATASCPALSSSHENASRRTERCG